MRSATLGIVLPANGAVSASPVHNREVLSDLLEAVTALGHRPVLLNADAGLVAAARRHEVDACVLLLHGNAGGRGAVQATLELAGIPFTGPSSQAVSMAFDKLQSRQLLAFHNVPVPTTVHLSPDQECDMRSVALLGWPCVVKPRRGAQCAGLRHVDRLADVTDAVDAALAVDDELLIERAYGGDEIQVVLLDGVLVGLAHLRTQTVGACRVSELVVPPEASRAKRAGWVNLARRAASAVDLHSGLVRVDLMVSERHNEVVLEVEPLPPFDRGSVVGRVATAHGLSTAHLLAAMLERPLQERRPLGPLLGRAEARG